MLKTLMPEIKAGQVWVWRDRPEPNTRRCFVTMPLRRARDSVGIEWESLVVYDDVNRTMTPYTDINYWPDGSHWELLSDA